MFLTPSPTWPMKSKHQVRRWLWRGFKIYFQYNSIISNSLWLFHETRFYYLSLLKYNSFIYFSLQKIFKFRNLFIHSDGIKVFQKILCIAWFFSSPMAEFSFDTRTKKQLIMKAHDVGSPYIVNLCYQYWLGQQLWQSCLLLVQV